MWSVALELSSLVQGSLEFGGSISALQNLALNPAPQAILLLCLRRLGDVLLVTPLLRSMRRAWPDAQIDAAVYAGTAAALEGNPDVSRVIRLSARTRWSEIAPLRRRYDLAVCTTYNDRPHLIALWAARRRVAVMPGPGEPGRWWKQALAQGQAPCDSLDTHTVVQYLQLADALGIARSYDVVPPRPPAGAADPLARLLPGRTRPYAVVHPAPMFTYKQWSLAAWRELLAWLVERVDVVVTGGPAAAERAYVAQVLEGAASGCIVDASGQLSLAELTPLIERAQVFIGPDTSVTHLAAATGTPTVTLFGPSNPVAWGPWPQGFAQAVRSPWTRTAPLQQRGNVWIVQGITHCVPCLGEGCERKLTSRSECLDQLPASRVIAVLAQLSQLRVRA
jgi:heptosyltransferase-3